MTDLMTTQAVETLLGLEIENWLRWGRRRDWMPMSFRCAIGLLYKSSEVHEASYRPLPCDGVLAVRLERLVVALPERHRQAFVLHHMERCAIKGKLRVAHVRNDKARLLGLQKTQYHELLRQAHNIVWREWQK